MATSRIKKTLSAIPASISEAMSYLISIGNKQREIDKIKRETKDKVDELNAEAKKKIEALTTDRDNFFTALFAFASPRKVELTSVTRSQKGEAGSFGWRWTTPYVELKEGATDAEIVKVLEVNGQSQYVRIIKEIDREALLRDRPKVFGLSYVQRDEFFAKPNLGKGNGRSEELVRSETEAIDTLP